MMQVIVRSIIQAMVCKNAKRQKGKKKGFKKWKMYFKNNVINMV
jgi:hypothetical protein